MIEIFISKVFFHGFEMRILACHPDYIEKNFYGACPKECNVKDFIICNIQFEGNMYYQNDKAKYSKDFEEYFMDNFDMLAMNYSDDDIPYLEDVYNKFYLIDPEHRRDEDEITSQIVNSIEQVMSWVYKDFNYTEEIKTDLATILNCMYWDYSPYQDEKGHFDITRHNEEYTDKILSIKWQNANIENRHEIYVNTNNSKELIIR